MPCRPLSEYSRPVYMTGHAPVAPAMRRASSRIVLGRNAGDLLGHLRREVLHVARELVEAVAPVLGEVLVEEILVDQDTDQGERQRSIGPRSDGYPAGTGRFAVSVRRGSMTTISAFLPAAAWMRCMSRGGESVAGLAPHTTMSSALSRSLNISVSVRPSVRCGAIIAKET